MYKEREDVKELYKETETERERKRERERRAGVSENRGWIKKGNRGEEWREKEGWKGGGRDEKFVDLSDAVSFNAHGAQI